MTDVVLDASALLAVLNNERGRDVVSAFLPRASMSAVNLAEVVTKLTDYGLSDEEVDATLGGINVEIVTFDEEQAGFAGRLQRRTRAHGFSLGDRACLALAGHLDLPALTADRQWADLDVGIQIRLIRD